MNIAPPRRWRVAEHADLTSRHWDGELVFHHALANDTHRLSDAAGRVLLQLVQADGSGFGKPRARVRVARRRCGSDPVGTRKIGFRRVALTLRNFPTQELCRRLADGLTLTTGPFRFRLQCRMESVAEGLATLYADFPVRDDTGFRDFHIRVDRSGLRRWFSRRSISGSTATRRSSRCRPTMPSPCSNGA